MPIKNYTTKVPVSRTVSEIQTSLVEHGATGVAYDYEKDTGRIEALRFKLFVNDKDVVFSLPVNWRKFQEVLKQQEIRRWDDEDYVYRVAWRNLKDWVEAQMVLYECQLVELPQIFLPFATDSKGSTLYDRLLSGQLLLDNPKKK